MNYNFLENNQFFILKDNHKISYDRLYLYLKSMKYNKEEDKKIKWDDKVKSEAFNLKLYKSDSENVFEFKIDSGLKIKINKKKSLCFYNEGKLINEIHIYNCNHIYAYYAALINEYKNIKFYDSEDNLINYADEDLFNKISYFQQISNLKKEEDDINKYDYYKKIFDAFLEQNFENEGEQFSFNLLEYSGQDPKTFKYYETNKRNEMIDSLSDFLDSKENILALTGVSGIGKTITLLNFLKLININNPNCYFNIKKLSRRANVEKLALEFIKLFKFKDSYNDYLNLIKLIEEKKHINLWEKIKLILDYISDRAIRNNKIIIVIDQYKLELDINLNLFNILQSGNYSSHFKFIICSSVNEKDIKSNITFSAIYKKLSLKNFLNYKFYRELFSVRSIIENDEIRALMQRFHYIPKYYYSFIKYYHEDIPNIEDNDKFQKAIKSFISDNFNDIKTKLVCFYNQNNTNLLANYNNICNILQGEPINESHFLYALQIIPLKYCNYHIKDYKVKFEAAFDFFYSPFRALYKEIETTDFIDIGLITQNRGELGNVFDSLVNSHFDVNKNAFGFDISHVIIVNEIIDFSYFCSIMHDDKDYFNKELDIMKLFDKKVIYLEQRNSNGQCVDGAFLIPNENSNTYSILFYQSSIKKRKHFSKEFIYNGIYLTTKKNIHGMFGIVITNCYFMYIIDQKDYETISYCSKTAIYYIFYEFSKRKFLYSNYKEIKNFDKNILKLLEIHKPNLELIKIFDEIEKSNDISEIKKNLLNKKRNINEDKEGNDDEEGEEEEEEDDDDDDKKDDKKKLKKKAKKIINNDKGYTNPEFDFFKINQIYGKKDLKGKNDNSEKKNKINKEIKIPSEWEKIFNNYNYYKLIQEDLNASNAIFEIPVFYISEEKYIIIKENNNDYSFYHTNTGEKLKDSELQKIYDSFNPFYKGKKNNHLNVYLLIKKN